MTARLKSPGFIAVALVLLVVGLFFAAPRALAAITGQTASCTSQPPIAVGTTSESITVKCSLPLPAPVTKTVTVTATPSPTQSPTPSPSPTSTTAPAPSSTPTVAPSPTATATSTPASSGTYACGPVPLGGGCPAYLDTAFAPESNGYNTYVTNQDFGASGTQSLYANSPSDWKLVSNLKDDGGRVLVFPHAQQLYYRNSMSDGPALSTLSALKVDYDETSPGGSNSYQFSPDLFFSNYGCSTCAGDIMFWVDVNGRCNEGAYGPSLLGHYTTSDGAGWTVHRYDDVPTSTSNNGNEIIIVKDGPGGPGTCAKDPKGSIDIKAGLAWLSANGFMPADPVLQIIQTGWEITSSSNATFTVNGLKYTATPK